MIISLSKKMYTTSLVTARIEKSKAEKSGRYINLRIEEEKEDIHGFLKPRTTVYYLKCDGKIP